MQSKMETKKPFILILYGYPGSGKSTFARSFASEIDNTVHLHYERVKAELKNTHLDEPTYQRLLEYMVREFVGAGMNVILDVPVTKKSGRQRVNKLAKELNTKVVMVWLQVDMESALDRLKKRDKRKANDKYSRSYTRNEFDTIVNNSQNPDGEDYVVISGKHTFNTQRAAVFKKLESLKILSQAQTMQKKIKPELVNIIPQLRGKDELRRRDISVR